MSARDRRERRLGTVATVRGATPEEEEARGAVQERRSGTVVLIGGAERKEGETPVLSEVARRVGDGRLLVATVATRHPEEVYATYREAFAALGVVNVAPLHVHDRGDAAREENLRAFEGATGVFFTGGDQLRITSHVDDTPMHDRIVELYRDGGVVAGTSAGASALGDTMIVTGPSDATHRMGDLLRMAQGLELVQDVIVDQHFAQRGRMGRLLGAVAQNPGSLGVGIDENTAVVLDDPESLRIVGAGSVYLVDGESMTHSNVGERIEDQALSAYDLALHVLADGDRFDLTDRRPVPAADVDAYDPDAVREERRERRRRDRRRGGDRRRGPRREEDRDADDADAAGRRAAGERRAGDRRGDDGSAPSEDA